jgi:hypothetical protein
VRCHLRAGDNLTSARRPLMSAKGPSPRIPLSPSSPPETGLKRRRQSEHPTNLPPSPPYMSVAAKSYVSSYGHTSHGDETASRSSPRSPPSSSSYAQQATQRESLPYSTPASSTGIPGLCMTEDPDQHRNKRQRMESDVQETADSMEVESSIQPTNHDRSVDLKKEESASPNVMVDPLNQPSDDASLDQLQKDMGDAFLLGRSSKALRLLTMLWHLLTFASRNSASVSSTRNPSARGIWFCASPQDCRPYRSRHWREDQQTAKIV